MNPPVVANDYRLEGVLFIYDVPNFVYIVRAQFIILQNNS